MSWFLGRYKEIEITSNRSNGYFFPGSIMTGWPSEPLSVLLYESCLEADEN
jgi:hypothetical protein